MLPELGKRTDEHSENFNEGIETIFFFFVLLFFYLFIFFFGQP